MLDRAAEIERICQAALDCPCDARADLLDVECRDDEDLRREVERLLAFEATADRFLEPDALPVPSRLGPFAITSILGIGGMGEVYGGRDTVLDREVALKVLPRVLPTDPERVPRLLREARVVASLNHPNIAQIYGVEQGALVMERVHGRTLQSPMPVAVALECARQIAAALEAAHEKGIVHRDLKSTNVMTTPDGTVKVLDFGLAAIDHESQSDGPGTWEDAPATATVTRAGVVMGTPSYMSPEQAAGKPVDKGGTPRRVTAAGDYGYPVFLPDGEQLLYTWFGRDPQPGVYVLDTREPESRPSKRLIDGPFVLSRYMPRAHTSSGVLLALREGVLTARSFDPRTTTMSGEPAVIAQDVPVVTPPGAFSASLTGALAFRTSTSADSSRLVWFDRAGRELGQLGPRSFGSNINMSPDGKQIAFDSIESDRRTRHMWAADPVRGVVTMVTAGPRAWTPAPATGGVIAFTLPPDLYLTRPSAIGAADLLYRSANPKVPNAWSPDGRFLTFNELHPTRRSDLYVLRVDDREAIPLVVTDADELPAVFSPDGNWIAYASDETGTREVYVRDFARDRVPAVGTVKVRVSSAGGDKPRWRQDGAELYYIAADGRLMAVPITRTPTFAAGPPIALFDVRVPSGSFFPYDVAPDGRFLVNTFDAPGTGQPGQMTVVLNWASR